MEITGGDGYATPTTYNDTHSGYTIRRLYTGVHVHPRAENFATQSYLADARYLSPVRSRARAFW